MSVWPEWGEGGGVKNMPALLFYIYMYTSLQFLFQSTWAVFPLSRGQSDISLQGHDQSPSGSRWDSTADREWQRGCEETGPCLPAVCQRLCQRSSAEWGSLGHPHQQRRYRVSLPPRPLSSYKIIYIIVLYIFYMYKYVYVYKIDNSLSVTCGNIYCKFLCIWTISGKRILYMYNIIWGSLSCHDFV